MFIIQQPVKEQIKKISETLTPVVLQTSNMKAIIRIVFVMLILLTGVSCEKDYYFETPPPHVAHATSTLEVSRVTSAPASITSSYWRTADFLQVNSVNVSTAQLYVDGLMNMTGIYNGHSSFNNGADPGLILKAAYDNDNLYILAEWTDLDVDASNGSWLWNGPVDPLKADASAGWTSQRNCDHIAFAFDINAASSPAGNFSSAGCAASCHANGGSSQMHPDAGKADLWNWSLAKSAPLGFAEDMIATADSIADDGGQKMFARNAMSTSNRSGPAYEWDGTTQTVTLSNGSSSTLDPGFYLVNKTPFVGDIPRGDSIYHRTSAPGDCQSCHGGSGEGGSATAINLISMNKKSRATLMTNMDNVPDMAPYWGGLSGSDRDDIVAFLRGLSGVPGNYLVAPNGSNADIKAISNVTPVNIRNATLPATNQHTKYQVLITRKLKTNNGDDAQFDIASHATYTFGVALMDNDGKNHIGSTVETLTFK
jgi:mono/diheme cytochrome c family protein